MNPRARVLKANSLGVNHLLLLQGAEEQGGLGG